MGVRVSVVNGLPEKVVLYDSVSGYPLFMPTFDNEQEALDFLAFAEDLKEGDLRRATPGHLEELHKIWWRAYQVHLRAEANQAVAEMHQQLREETVEQLDQLGIGFGKRGGQHV